MRAEKLQLSKDLGALMGSSAHIYMMSYQGLTVAKFGDLRRKLAVLGAECHVVPNRVVLKAATAAKIGGLERAELKGDNAMITGGADSVAVAKVLKAFAKDHEQVRIKCGTLQGKYLLADEVAQLADLPAREILLSQLLGVLQAPQRNLVSVLNAKVASIVYVVQAYLDSKQQA